MAASSIVSSLPTGLRGSTPAIARLLFAPSGRHKNCELGKQRLGSGQIRRPWSRGTGERQTRDDGKSPPPRFSGANHLTRAQLTPMKFQIPHLHAAAPAQASVYGIACVYPSPLEHCHRERLLDPHVTISNRVHTATHAVV